MGTIARIGAQTPDFLLRLAKDLTHTRDGNATEYIYFTCEDVFFRVDRAKLELRTSRYSDLKEARVLQFDIKQKWALKLLFDIVCGPSHESIATDWRAAYRDAVSRMQNVTCLKAHAHLYAIAPRLGMYELQAYAIEMFKMESQIEGTQRHVMCDAVVAVYTEIDVSPNDMMLRETIVDAWLMGGRQLAEAIGREGFIDLMAVVPEFVADLHARMMAGSDLWDSPDRLQYLCNECGHRGSREFESRSGGKSGKPYCKRCGIGSTACDLLAGVRLNHLPVSGRHEN